MRWLILLFLAAFCSTPAFAQDCSDILKDGAYSRTQIETSDAVNKAYRYRLASMTFQQAKSSLSGSISVPIKGIPLQAGFDQNQFNEFQQSVRTSSDYSDVEAHLGSVFLSSGDHEITTAWSECMHQRGGLGVRPAALNATTVQFRVIWWPTAGSEGRSPTVESYALIGGQILGGSSWITRGRQLGVAVERIITVRRPANMPVTFALSTDFGDVTGYVARPSPLPRLRPVLRLLIGSCLGHNGLEGVRFWGPANEDCNGLGNPVWGKYDAQVREVKLLGSCVGKQGVQDITLYGPVGETCGGIPAWGLVYSNAIDIEKVGLSSCAAGPSAMEQHVIWGPTGAKCGGLWERTYSSNTHKPQ